MSTTTAASLSTVNPSTGQTISQYEIMDREQVTLTVKQARKAFGNWKGIGISKRAEFIRDFAQELRRNKADLAKTATQEMGKPIKESIAEVEKCAWVSEYYADNGPIFLNDEVVNTDARKSIITFQPLGVVGSIMPWNFPYWQALRFATPSLMAGNTKS